MRDGDGSLGAGRPEQTRGRHENEKFTLGRRHKREMLFRHRSSMATGNDVRTATKTARGGAAVVETRALRYIGAKAEYSAEQKQQSSHAKELGR